MHLIYAIYLMKLLILAVILLKLLVLVEVMTSSMCSWPAMGQYL